MPSRTRSFSSKSARPHSHRRAGNFITSLPSLAPFNSNFSLIPSPLSHHASTTSAEALRRRPRQWRRSDSQPDPHALPTKIPVRRRNSIGFSSADRLREILEQPCRPQDGALLGAHHEGTLSNTSPAPAHRFDSRAATDDTPSFAEGNG